MTIFFILVMQFCFTQKVTRIEEVPIYKLIDQSLICVLDSFVSQAKKCCSFEQKWMFYITIDSSSIHFQFGEKLNFWLPDEKKIKQVICFYNSYCFLISLRNGNLIDYYFTNTGTFKEVIRVKYNNDLSFYDKKRKILYIDPRLEDMDAIDKNAIYWVYKIVDYNLIKIVEHTTCE